MRLQDSAKFKFAVGPSDGIGIDCQIDSKLAYRGQLVADAQRGRSNTAPHLINDLAIHGYATVQVKSKAESRRSGVHKT